MSSEAPTDLEMELRRNLTPCRCKHVFLDHKLLACLLCRCVTFREAV